MLLLLYIYIANIYYGKSILRRAKALLRLVELVEETFRIRPITVIRALELLELYVLLL